MNSRRGFLKLLAAAPIAAPAAMNGIGQIAAQQAKSLRLPFAGYNNVVGCEATPPSSRSPIKVTNFKKWLKDCHNEYREKPECLDPDLALMHLPLPTLYRIQFNRNKQRWIKSRKEWFDREISLMGFVEYWS